MDVKIFAEKDSDNYLRKLSLTEKAIVFYRYI